MTALMDRLVARKIERVICIDDENAIPNIDTVDALIDALVKGSQKSVRELARRDHRFQKIADKRVELVDASVEDLRVELRPNIQELIDNGGLGEADYRTVAEIVYRRHRGETARKLAVPFTAQKIKPVSFADWERMREEIISNATPEARLLLLVDERNDSETVTSLNGTQLLVDLWRGHHGAMQYIDAIVLTSSCTAEQEFEESRRLLNELRDRVADVAVRDKIGRVFVVSKERLQQNGLEDQFRVHIDRISAGEIRTELADLMREILGNAIDDALRWLEEIPLSEFHGSIFVSSQNEGSAEIDTLLRLAAIRQRRELEKELQLTGRLRLKIAQMRRYTLKHLDADYARASRTELRELRQQEFERSADSLNVLHTPLSCGDVFKLTGLRAGNQVERFAALLFNPCDLTIRFNGRRKAKRGWFVPVEKLTRAEIEKFVREQRGDAAELLYALYTGEDKSDVGYLFTNSMVDAVDLDALDLCWLNTDGAALLDPRVASPALDMMLPAQRKRAVALARKAASGAFRDLELFGIDIPVTQTSISLTRFDGVELSCCLRYPIQRVFQLAPEFASAALSSLAQSVARPVFGHDFMRTSD